MLKSIRFIVLFIFISFSYIKCLDDPLPVIHDYKTEAIIECKKKLILVRKVNNIEKHNHTINFRLLEDNSTPNITNEENIVEPVLIKKFISRLDTDTKNEMKVYIYYLYRK
jgi:hypothetical protein